MPADGLPDVVIRLGSVSTIDKATLDYGHRVIGELPEIGHFLIENGRFVTIEPAAGVDLATLRPSILGPVMAVVLRQRGLLVLHASSIAINHQAIAFLGGSGWGKSTLAKAFHAQGYDVLTDDVMAVDVRSDPAIVYPAFPQFKLSPAAAESLGEDATTLLPVFPSAPKLSCRFIDGFQQTPLPLQCVYVLGKGDRHEIVSLAPQAAFPEVVRHTRAMELLNAPAMVATHLQDCTRLITTVPFRRFIRKPSLAELPDLVRLVEEDVAVPLIAARSIC